jgi:hypothetical protein
MRFLPFLARLFPLLLFCVSAQASGFGPPVNYPVGPDAVFVATGDFNGDGKLDLAVANSAQTGGTPSVSVLLNSGDGTFQPAVNYAVGLTAEWVTVGDFNHDGKLDLAVPDTASSSVDVLLGNGDGTFSAPVTSPAGPVPLSLAAGDLNGDGKLDLLVGNGVADVITVILGNGDGTFTKFASFSSDGLHPVQVALADFNHDGRLDVAALESIVDVPEARIGVFLGNGDGTFQNQILNHVIINWVNFSVGDVNQDGNQDIVVASTGNLQVLLGVGDGTFQAGWHSQLRDANEGWAALADFNGDGKLDVAVTKRHGVFVMGGVGDGSFHLAGEVRSGVGVYVAAAADLNGDQAPDLVLVNLVADVVTVLLNRP